MDAIVNQIGKSIKDNFLTFLWTEFPQLVDCVPLADAKAKFDEWANIPQKAKKSPVTKKPTPLNSFVGPDKLPVGYKEFKIAQLKELCKERGQKVTGTKQSLIERLELWHSDQGSDDTHVTAKTETKPEPKVAIKAAAKPLPTLLKNVKKTKAIPKVKPIVEPETMSLEKDDMGILVDPKTNMVFDENYEAYGYKDEEDNIRPLTAKLIDYCKQHNIIYTIPDELELEEEDPEMTDDESQTQE